MILPACLVDEVIQILHLLPSGVGDYNVRRGCIDADRLLLLVVRDLLQDQAVQPIDGVGGIYLDRATMIAGRGAGTVKPSGGGGRRLCGQEETEGR